MGDAEPMPPAPRLRLPMQETRLSLAGRDWTILHMGVILTYAEEKQFLDQSRNPLPYGVALWPASLSLASEVAARADQWAGRSVLELGAGIGLPGLVAATLGADVTLTDNEETVINVSRTNAEENRVGGVRHRLVDWTDWHDERRYDWIIGADITYAEEMHSHLTHIFETNLAPGGRLLLADSLREPSLGLFETLNDDGWDITVALTELGEGDDERTVALYDMSRG